MQIKDLDPNDIMVEAKKCFPSSYIELDTIDFYLPDVETGELQIDGFDHTIYVSTHYAYEDRLINGNQTRYKVKLPIIYTKKDAFEILYTNEGKCFVACLDDKIKFIPYEDFYDTMKEFIHKVDKKGEH